MIIITNEYGQRVLIPNDLDTEWLLPIEEQDLPEEERNYTQAVYIANVLTLADCERMYVEVQRGDSADKQQKIKDSEKE